MKKLKTFYIYNQDHLDRIEKEWFSSDNQRRGHVMRIDREKCFIVTDLPLNSIRKMFSFVMVKDH